MPRRPESPTPPDGSAGIEDRLRVALNVTRLLVFHMDRQLRYTWIANPVLGLEANAVIGRTDAELLGAEQARPLTHFKRRVLRSGVGDRQELWIGRAGHRGCYDLIAEPQRDAAGRVVGLVCAAADITERKLAQQALVTAHQSLRHLAAHMQDSIEAERRAVAQDVHDDLGSTIAGLHLRLQAMARAAPAGAQRRQLDSLVATTDQAMQTVRALCARLRPSGLDDLGLTEALRQHLRQWSAGCGVRVHGRLARLQPEPVPALRTDLFRIAQELLHNVAAHARATQVRVTLSSAAAGVRLRVADDGRGFDASAPTRGLGLVGLRERVARRGGSLQFVSGASGTTVDVRMPLR